MKQTELSKDPYCLELYKYNKTHRLIGNVSCETLLEESMLAIENSYSALSKYSLMVDVGAGSGVMGYAWLLRATDKKAVFLEPDKKAAAFLHLFFSTKNNCKVIHKRLEDLSLDELLKVEPQKEKICLVARAFSSSMSLDECYKKSKLDLPLFVFDKRRGAFGVFPHE